jgi:Glycosyltransferases involved in cell wall biogenesis
MDSTFQHSGLARAEFLALDVRDFYGRSGPGAPHTEASPARTDSGAAVTSTVLVNTFNHERFIEECIDSLLVQTVLPNEIIVHDDGSTDNTVALLRRYGSRIKLIETPAAREPAYVRQVRAIERSFANSSGRLVFLLDGDDRFKRDKVEQYVSTFVANPDVALIQSPMTKIDEHGRVLGTNLEPRKHVVEHLKAIYRHQDVDFYYPSSSLAFSRSYLECALPLDLSDGHPLWADTRLSIVAPYFGRVITLPDVLTDWRRHVGSDSVRARSRRLQLQQTLMRTRVFNHFCRRHGLRTISPWRNARFYLQLLRFSLPDTAYALIHRRVYPRAAYPV